MKTLFKLGLIVILVISIVGCSNKEMNQLPIAKVGLDHTQIDNDTHVFDWYVENASDTENILTFSNGNITNYEIKNLRLNKKYTSSDYEVLPNFELVNEQYISNSNKENCTVILKPGERYHKTIVIQALEEGNYSAKFWAISEEGTAPSMTTNFNVNH